MSRTINLDEYLKIEADRILTIACTVVWNLMPPKGESLNTYEALLLEKFGRIRDEIMSARADIKAHKEGDK